MDYRQTGQGDRSQVSRYSTRASDTIGLTNYLARFLKVHSLPAPQQPTRLVCATVRTAGALLITLIASANAHAAATLKGVVVLNRERGQPVANVAIGAEGANPTVSDALGRFVLGFPGRQPGDRVRVLVTGWAVVNEIQLERELPGDADRRPLEVIICKEAEREQWALQFYRLKGREAAEGTYRRELEELEKSQAAISEERARLRRERDQALAQVEELAKQLAAATATPRSDTYQRASRLFLDGRLDEALGVLSEAQLRREAESATQAVQQAMQAYLLRGQLLALKFQFGEAARAYEEAVRLTPQHWNTWFNYAVFHQRLRRFAEAEKGYGEALSIARREANSPAVAMTLNNLGILYHAQNRPGEARQAYEEALALRRALAATNPEAYLPEVAATLNNLGLLHATQNHLGEAQQAYEEALALRRALAATNPEAYRPELATTLNNLGILYRAQNRPGEARRAYEEALALRRALAATNPEAYRPEVAVTLNNLGNLHMAQNRLAAARQAYEEALTLDRALAATNPEAYRPELATTLNNLGNLHRVQNRPEAARQAYEEALALRRVLSTTNPQAYRLDLAMTLTNLGILHAIQNRPGEARQAYEEALSIYKEFAATDPEKFTGDVERVQQLLRRLRP